MEDNQIITTRAKYFTDEYKEEVFYVWYNAGKIGARDLFDRIPFPVTNFGNKPVVTTLSQWILEFSERALELDKGVRKTMDEATVKAKIEMLERHVEAGKEMQKVALKWLSENFDKLTASAVVRLLTDGLKVEREAVGIPGMLEKLADSSDEELLKQLEDIIQEAEIKRDDD